ncbi:hypothetical protein C0991_003977 [Blastosporella zonata]|nr:hypothetical protein C0991_003977 [Blastosporella zonata]
MTTRLSRAATFTMEDSTTAKFRNARPYAVLSISPALAALYTSQSTLSSVNTDWCSKCGSYLLNGDAETRIVRLKSRKGRPPTRALRTICRCCGWHIDILLGSERTAIHVVPSDNLISTPSPAPFTPSIPPSHLSTPPPSSSSQESSAQAKTRSKKKSGLQLLLLKNREKVTQERNGSPASGGGLSAFLSGL